MDDMKVSLSVPATIYSFGETQSLTQNKYVTPAKLKVFYIGQTGDKRVFTKKFSEQLLKTLPGTPVVAYYNEETDDFKGHNPIQYIFGYVPETATIEFIVEKNITYALTDVKLFTGREDNIGMVARKIIGHAHSLELDPKTVNYTIVRANNAIESITFNEGHFIGLSVLGKSEQPAFNGSSFFTEKDELQTFVNSFEEFKREVELDKSGGQLMNEVENLPILEDQTEVVTEVAAETPEITVTSIITDSIPMNPEVKPMDEEEMPMDKPTIETSETDVPPMVKPEEEEDMTVNAEVETEIEQPVIKSEIGSEVIADAQTLEGPEDVREQTKENKEIGEIANSTALNQAERQELNEYRKKAKFELIDSYNDLSSELKNKYRNTHEKFSIEELDMNLAFELVKSQRQYNKNNGVRVFAAIQETPKADTLVDMINRYKD